MTQDTRKYDVMTVKVKGESTILEMTREEWELVNDFQTGRMTPGQREFNNLTGDTMRMMVNRRLAPTLLQYGYEVNVVYGCPTLELLFWRYHG